MAISPKKVDEAGVQEMVPAWGTSVQMVVGAGAKSWKAITIPHREGNLYCSHIMQVGQSLVANKNELMAETAAGTPEEDLEKLWEAVEKDKPGTRKVEDLGHPCGPPHGLQAHLGGSKAVCDHPGMTSGLV